MGYKVKWVEENLGVSRKALRNFEKHGLMPANEGGAYRDYSDEDIERIWAIRLFQGMGYTLKELVKLSESDDFDFDASLEKKIQELENEKAKIERHLGYAQHIKLTGRFPSRPKNMGTIPFEEFQEKSLNQWNVNSDPEAKKYQEIADLILNTPEDELKDTDIGRLFEFLIELQEQMSDMDSLFIEKVIPNEIIKRIENERVEPHPEEILIMAQKYKSPELCNYYCSNQCPIGQQYVPEVKIQDLSQIVLKMVDSLNTVQDNQRRLISITADGIVDDSEIDDFVSIQEELEKISITVEALQLWTEQMVANGAIDMDKYEARRKRK